MSNYSFKKYEPGFEIEQAKIAEENAMEWIWPFYFTAEAFQQKYSQPNFDLDTVLYCFDEDQMVGYIHVDIGSSEGVFGPNFEEEDGVGASFDIPRVKKGYEEVAELLLEEMIIILKEKGISFLLTRVTTMRKHSQQLVENFGFKPHQDFPMDYKYYYVYDLTKGIITFDTNDITDFNLEEDLEQCSKRIASYFKMSLEEAKNFLSEINDEQELINHLIIKRNSKIEGYSYALPNSLKRETIATYYLEASNDEYLKQLLVRTIEDCITKKAKYFLVDVIGDLQEYLGAFEKLNFKKEATWGIYVKRLD
ncbi:MAG: hypothetical protein JXA54_10650 [Candidatus Heimdallarchaeota archaeon]|nr:hypothetical protein [Candidatus Heimdallarchaeota archaeon]